MIPLKARRKIPNQPYQTLVFMSEMVGLRVEHDPFHTPNAR